MELRPFGATGLAGVGHRLRVPGGRWRLRRHRRGASSRAPSGRRSISASTCFDTAEAYGFGASEEALGRALGGRRDEAIVVHQVRHRVPGPPELPRRAAGAGARVDRREPAAPRYRPRRRVHRALARPRDAVRGDAGRARRSRARRARCASSVSRTSPSTSSTACMQMRRGRRRAVRARPVRPADGARGAAVLRGARHRVRRPTARSPTGC